MTLTKNRRISINGKRYTVLSVNANRLLVRSKDYVGSRWILNPRVQLDLKTYLCARSALC